MGSPECEWARGRNSQNENETRLTHDFVMKQTEVTQADWMSLGLPNPSKTSDAPRLDCADPTCPVGNVDWYEALEFANRLSTAKGKKACYALEGCEGDPGTGMTCTGAHAVDASIYDCDGYRLPTEAEWEYAARAGSRWATYAGDLHPHTDITACASEPVLDPIAWYCANAGNTTHPVKQLEPNDWGLFDMAGNVAEWTSDVFDGLGYGLEPRTDPGAHIAPDITMTVRGGLAYGYPMLAKSAQRDQIGPAQHDAGIGFRLVRTTK
jgi:formylglycine-generating enzyme required for sulfatase activity